MEFPEHFAVRPVMESRADRLRLPWIVEGRHYVLLKNVPTDREGYEALMTRVTTQLSTQVKLVYSTSQHSDISIQQKQQVENGNGEKQPPSSKRLKFGDVVVLEVESEADAVHLGVIIDGNRFAAYDQSTNLPPVRASAMNL